jgi:hypothetical protein
MLVNNLPILCINNTSKTSRLLVGLKQVMRLIASYMMIMMVVIYFMLLLKNYGSIE